MDIREISTAIKQASDAIHANEKFAIPILAARARRAAQECPHDAPLVTASQVLTKMASSDKMFISRTDLNKLYDQLYAPNTKLAEVFSEELDRNVLKSPQVFQRSQDEGVSIDQDYERVADPLLSNALSAAFDGKYQPYSKKIAQAAERSCMRELNGLGVPPKQVEVFAGQEDLILCRAAYETPKGQSSVLIPIEIKDDHALLPTIFVSEAGFTDLDTETLTRHIISTAGRSFRADGEGILRVLSNAKNGIKKVASTVEMAAMKIRAAKEATPELPAIFASMDNPIDPVKLPEIPKTAEEESFASRLSKPDGIARQVFGSQAVDAGRNMIAKRMARMGYRNVQVKVADVTDNTIYYAAALGVSAGIKVPVTIKNGVVNQPTVAIASGKVKEFSKAGLSELFEKPDGKMAAVASPAYGLRPSELLERVKQAIADDNLVKAEDAINVLGEVDPKAQKQAIRMLMAALGGEEITKTASVVVKDACDVAPYFMTNKIFFPDGV